MSFADLEERTNAAVMRRLSNARALKVGAIADIPVIFDRAAMVQTDTGITATMPIADALDSDIVGYVAHVTQLTINAVTYTVRDLQPDGTGITKLVLEVS